MQYEGLRRFQLLAVDHDARPYALGAAAWLDDAAGGALTEQQRVLTGELERAVLDLLQQASKYSRVLDDAAPAGLPDALLRHMPPPLTQRQRGVADYLAQAGEYDCVTVTV